MSDKNTAVHPRHSVVGWMPGDRVRFRPEPWDGAGTLPGTWHTVVGFADPAAHGGSCVYVVLDCGGGFRLDLFDAHERAAPAPTRKPGRPTASPDGRPRYRCTVSLPPELGDYIEARVAAGEKRSAVVARAVRLLVESGQ